MMKFGLVVLMSLAVVAFAQEKKEAKKQQAKVYHGYVVDYMCAKGMIKKNNPMERAAKHTKECAMEEACAASGYGLVYDNGKWIKFDKNGDELARAMFEKAEQDNNFAADVKGEMKDGQLMVASLTLSSQTDDAKKPAMHEGAHDHK